MKERKVTLGEIISLAKVQRAGQSALPILSMTMRNGLVDQTSKFKKRVASEDTSDYKIVEKGQLVVGFPIDEGVLSFQNLYPKAIVSPAYGVWDVGATTKVDSAYLEKYLRSPIAIGYYASKLRSTTARRRSLPQDVFLALPVPLPPLEEQRRIAAILDKADALRQKRKQAIALLDSLTQSIFLEMFGDPRRNIAGWRTRPLKSLGHTVTGKTPPTRDPKNFDGEFPFATPGDLRSGAPAKRTISLKGKAFTKTAPAGSALVCCIGATIGKMDIATSETAFNQQINAVIWGDEIDPIFGINALNFMTPEIISRGISTTLPILKKSEFEKLEIIVPDMTLQKVFSVRTTKVQTAKETMKRIATKADDLWFALQHRAFSGQL